MAIIDPVYKIKQARSGIIVREGMSFYAALALRLPEVATDDPRIWAMATDGISLYYNPEWVIKCPLPELKGTIVHEVMHAALGHIWRKGARSDERWNAACDYVVNYYVEAAGEKSGFKLPPNVLRDPQYDGMSAEQIYTLLPDMPPSQIFNVGGMLPPPAGTNPSSAAAEWRTEVVRAAQAAKMRGKLPGGIDRLVDEIKQPVVDWKAALYRFIQETAKADYSMRRPNRRYMQQGFYIPSLRSETMPPVVIYWDTSGSRDFKEARMECANEVSSVIEDCRPERTHVIYGDAVVQRVDVFEPGDPIVFKPIGGGGTCFEPIFEYIERQDIEPACFIGITDLYGSFPKYAPEYPVLWAATTNAQAPFGEIIRIGGRNAGY